MTGVKSCLFFKNTPSGVYPSSIRPSVQEIEIILIKAKGLTKNNRSTKLLIFQKTPSGICHSSLRPSVQEIQKCPITPIRKTNYVN